MFLAPNYSNVDLPQDVTVTLVGLDGIVRVRQINGTNSSGEDVRAGQLLREVRNAEIGNFISFTPIDGRRRATSYRKLPNFPMVVLVGSPVDQVTDALMGNERAYLLSAFLGNLLVIALAIGIYTAFARGRQRFAQAAASAERMRAIIDASPVPMALNDPVGRITFLNRSFIETFGYGPEDIPTLDAWWRSAYPDLTYRAWVIDTWGEEIKRTQKTGTNFTPMEIKLQCKDGSEKFAIASAARYSPVQDAEHLAVLFDITQHKLAEQAIQSSLLDKEALLREVHHRVKNNLQIISSLIRLEAGRSHQEELQSVLGDMQGRVRSMALLHETLYRGQSFAQIDLGEYLRQLALQVFSTNLSKRAPIELKLEVSSVSVTLDKPFRVDCWPTN
jgi:PAS domain S-box-containing protein